MQPKIYELMVINCMNTIDSHSRTQITTPNVQQAAQAVLGKLKKYERDSSSFALVLNPRNENDSFVASHLKEPIRELSIVEEDYYLEPNVEQMAENEFDLFMACREAQGDAAVPSKVVHKYFELTKDPDTKCKDAIEWWKTVGK
jgi:hypothetical protein